jgi:hypothetical protein
MVDFHSILAKAIDALDTNTREARWNLYERARAALIAETRGSDPALNQSDFLVAWGSLEEAIGKVEAEAQRERFTHRPTATTSTSLPRGGIAAASTPPAKRIGEKRRRRLIRFLIHAFRRNPDCAPSNEPRRPADRNEWPSSGFSGGMDSDQSRDNWLSDLLARASRDEHESGDDRAEPRRDRRRNG